MIGILCTAIAALMVLCAYFLFMVIDICREIGDE